jgi:PUA domain protein
MDPLPDDAMIRFVEYGDGVITVDGDAKLFYDDETVYPLLPFLLENNFLDAVTIDMGAVPAISSGADVMTPGVVDAAPGISKGSIVSVVDEDNNKPIAVATSLMDAENLRSNNSGVGATNQHYVGDTLWDEFF